MAFKYYKNRFRFLSTPSEIHASTLPRAIIKLAKRYAQCCSKQNKQYHSGGVEKTILGNLDEGGSNNKMCTATRVRATKLSFSTPLTREAHFCVSTITVNEKKSCWGLGGRDIAM